MTTDEKVDKLITILESKKSYNPIVASTIASITASIIISVIIYVVSIPNTIDVRIDTLEKKLERLIQDYEYTMSDIHYNFNMIDTDIKFKSVHKENLQTRGSNTNKNK